MKKIELLLLGLSNLAVKQSSDSSETAQSLQIMLERKCLS